jgi:CheY-like chemotaxis protein
MLATDTRIVTETPDSLDHVRRRLVEDNEINRKVATRFLNKWGIWPDYACNGKDALQKVQEKDYDLILMDLQMPEMDGYEASRIIREQKSADGLPIVALTASAMHDVSRQIYAAGMNDFVTKPFHPDDLYRKIARYTSLKHPAAAPAANHEATVHKLAAGDILDIKGLMKVIGSGSEFLEEMILMHIDMFREFAQEYRQIMEQRDRKRLRFIFHRVKAPCAMLSIKMLEEETGLPKNYWMTQKYLRLK